MAITILNPARFNNDGGVGGRQFIRAAFFDEGYGSSESFFAYRQGGGIVPSTSTFNIIGAGTAGDPLRMSQFSGFVVPAIVDISNKTTSTTGRAYDSGSASASILHKFNSDKTYEIEATNVGLPDNGGTVTGNQGFQTDWLRGGSAADFSMKYTFTGDAPRVDIGGVSFRTANTYFALAGGGAVAEVSLNVNQFGAGSSGENSTVTISIVKTSNTSAVLDSAVLTLDVGAQVSSSPNPD